MPPDSNPQSNPFLDHFLTTLAPIEAVMKHSVRTDEHVIMLAVDGQYSVCRLHPTRRVVTAPNYYVQSEHGLLSAKLDKAGLSHLLHWTDRETALSRFIRLANPVTADHSKHLSIVDPDRAPP
jgi:hypothetical protein